MGPLREATRISSARPCHSHHFPYCTISILLSVFQYERVLNSMHNSLTVWLNNSVWLSNIHFPKSTIYIEMQSLGPTATVSTCPNGQKGIYLVAQASWQLNTVAVLARPYHLSIIEAYPWVMYFSWRVCRLYFHAQYPNFSKQAYPFVMQTTFYFIYISWLILLFYKNHAFTLLIAYDHHGCTSTESVCLGWAAVYSVFVDHSTAYTLLFWCLVLPPTRIMHAKSSQHSLDWSTILQQ